MHDKEARESVLETLAALGVTPLDGEHPQLTFFRFMSSPDALPALTQRVWSLINDERVPPETAVKLAILGAVPLQDCRPDLAAQLLRRALERAPNRSAEKMLQGLGGRAPTARRGVGAPSARCTDEPSER